MKHGSFAMMVLFACLVPGVGAVGVAGSKTAPDDDPNVPYRTFDSTPAITMGPLLLDMSDTSVIIEWMTDAPSDGRVSYGEDKLDHEVLPQVDGMVPVGTMHRVLIEGLKPGSRYQYRVASRRVVVLKPYWPDMGKTVESATGSFLLS